MKYICAKISYERYIMSQPGLDDRHRDEDGEIRQKRSDTLNGNLPQPIPQFRSDATLGRMREETGKVSEKDVRREAKRIRPDK
jgi:hypothetical protein